MDRHTTLRLAVTNEGGGHPVYIEGYRGYAKL